MRQRIHLALYYWLPLVAYGLLMFVQSSFPSPESVPDIPYMDKLLHLAAYAVMGGLFYRAFGTTGLARHPKRLLIASVLASVLYGLSDELHQHFVPARSAELLDLAADTVGSMAGAYGWQAMGGRYRGWFKRPRQ